MEVAAVFDDSPPLFETTFVVLLLQTTNAFNGVI